MAHTEDKALEEEINPAHDDHLGHHHHHLRFHPRHHPVHGGRVHRVRWGWGCVALGRAIFKVDPCFKRLGEMS